ncbi:MAG: Aurachin B dehydrogenase [Phycisphaerae bacterium]|nr:Aurachin B dehydrogenase [Phycisphaerae bacterium]
MASDLNLVTGGTGLLGSHIVEQLVNRGQPVRALVRPGSDRAFLAGLGVELVDGDVTDADSLARACKGVGTVYHAAARVGDWGPWPQFVAITIEGTRNMLAAATAAGVGRFLHVSSISAYGHPDGEGLVLDERAPLGANLHKWSYYSRAKVAAERLVWDAWEKAKFPVTVVRPSWLYGLRDRASMPRLVDAVRSGKVKVIGDGKNRMNLTNAANEAEGCILAATNPKAVGESYNLSNDGVITQQEYFTKIAEELGVEPKFKHVPYRIAKFGALVMELFGRLTRRKRPPLATRYSVWLIGRRCFFSCNKARTELGWKATIGYDQGIREAVQWELARRQSEGA